MAVIPAFVGAILFTIIQAIVFLFTLIGTPLPQFKSGSWFCQTLFGVQDRCKSSYLFRNNKLGCNRRRDVMNAGAAFAIISIFATLVALIFGVLMIAKVKCAVFIPLVFVCISIFTLTIAWACPASYKTTKMCGLKLDHDYGAGFGLLVTAWVLQVINLVILIIVACC